MFVIPQNSTETAAALKAGFSFAVERPLNHESIERTLRAAFGMIIRERRRSFRCPIRVPATALIRGSENAIFGETVNVSETGMALRTSNPLPAGTELTAEFDLPNESAL